MENELEKILIDKYNLEVAQVQKNLQSTTGNVYIADNKYVIKIYKDIEHTKSMVKLHKILEQNKLYVPKVIRNMLGEE